MWNQSFPRGRLAALLIALGVPGATVSAEPVDEPVRVVLTAADIRASNEEAAAAYAALVRMWTNELQRIGVRFVAPRFVRYRGATRTRCGVMPAQNASYCLNSNTIYFDDAFLAAQAKVTGRALGTDGDMAAVGIIAHEMGHAVAMQLGVISRRPYRNEAIADCLAGAFARHAESDGSLEDGDLDEAFYAMAAAGDHEGGRTSHGTREQRMANFRSGLRGGGGACLDELS